MFELDTLNITQQKSLPGMQTVNPKYLRGLDVVLTVLTGLPQVCLPALSAVIAFYMKAVLALTSEYPDRRLGLMDCSR